MSILNAFRRRVYRRSPPPDCPLHGPLVWTFSGWRCVRRTCDYNKPKKENRR